MQTQLRAEVPTHKDEAGFFPVEVPPIRPAPAALMGMVKVKVIVESLLAEWQKLQAIQQYIIPTLDYTLRTMLPTKKLASDLDNQTRQVIKKAFCLPRNTSTPVLHCAWKSGSLGLPYVVDDLHIVQVSQALSS